MKTIKLLYATTLWVQLLLFCDRSAKQTVHLLVYWILASVSRSHLPSFVDIFPKYLKSATYWGLLLSFDVKFAQCFLVVIISCLSSLTIVPVFKQLVLKYVSVSESSLLAMWNVLWSSTELLIILAVNSMLANRCLE